MVSAHCKAFLDRTISLPLILLLLCRRLILLSLVPLFLISQYLPPLHYPIYLFLYLHIFIYRCLNVMIDIYFYDSRFRCLYYHTFLLACTSYPTVHIHVFSSHSAIKHQSIILFSLCPISFCSCTSVMRQVGIIISFFLYRCSC